jgi:hypothetical protein
MDWLYTLHYHLRRGPVRVLKRSLRRVLNVTDTREACRILSVATAPYQVRFVPDPDCDHVILVRLPIS